MRKLKKDIQACTICKEYLPLGPRPVVSFNSKSKILIIGQAPGTAVHKTGVPWDDPSGRQLRKWLGVDNDSFYNEDHFALVPMGFCYPGKGKGGDLPPRPECAPQWHMSILSQLKNIELTILIGQYAQKHYLKSNLKSNLTESVKAFEEYGPKFLPLPHPSPRNRFWLSKNPWFEENVVPYLQLRVKQILDETS